MRRVRGPDAGDAYPRLEKKESRKVILSTANFKITIDYGTTIPCTSTINSPFPTHIHSLLLPRRSSPHGLQVDPGPPRSLIFPPTGTLFPLLASPPLPLDLYLCERTIASFLPLPNTAPAASPPWMTAHRDSTPERQDNLETSIPQLPRIVRPWPVKWHQQWGWP